MKPAAFTLLLAVLVPIAAFAEETVRLDLDGVPRLGVKRPDSTFEPHHFRTSDRRIGWIVRVPTGRRHESQSARNMETFPSPTVAFGRVFVGGGSNSRQISAFEAATGRKLWTTVLDDNGPSPSAVTPDRVVTGTESCTTYGLNPRTGAREWANWLGPNIHGIPTVTGDRVLVAYHRKSEEEGVDGGFALAALRLKDGSKVWETPLDHDVYGAPVCALGRIFVTPRSNEVRCLDEDGKPLWRSRLAARSAPWLGSGGLYVGVRAGGGHAVAALDPLTGKRLWESAPVGDSRPARTRTRETAVGRPWAPHPNGWCCDPPRPVETGAGVVFANRAELVVLDPGSGKLRRRVRLPDGRAFSAPPAILGDRLLFATLDGLLLEIDPRLGAVRRALDVGVRLTSQPVVAKGRVHLAAEEFVFGIPWGDEDTADWPEWGGGATRTGR